MLNQQTTTSYINHKIFCLIYPQHVLNLMVKFRTFIHHKLATNGFTALYDMYVTMYIFAKEANNKLPI